MRPAAGSHDGHVVDLAGWSPEEADLGMGEASGVPGSGEMVTAPATGACTPMGPATRSTGRITANALCARHIRRGPLADSLPADLPAVALALAVLSLVRTLALSSLCGSPTGARPAQAPPRIAVTAISGVIQDAANRGDRCFTWYLAMPPTLLRSCNSPCVTWLRALRDPAPPVRTRRRTPRCGSTRRDRSLSDL